MRLGKGKGAIGADLARLDISRADVAVELDERRVLDVAQPLKQRDLALQARVAHPAIRDELDCDRLSCYEVVAKKHSAVRTAAELGRGRDEATRNSTRRDLRVDRDRERLGFLRSCQAD